MGKRRVLAAGRTAIQKEPQVAPLVSMALFNGLVRATIQDHPRMSDLLLDELRGLHRGWPEDAAVREVLSPFTNRPGIYPDDDGFFEV